MGLPNFKNRYFEEDIPQGLVVYKGVAELAGVSTPLMTKIIEWAQHHMQKEYLVDGRLVGKHVNETNAPQRFGLFTVAQLAGTEPPGRPAVGSEPTLARL